MNESSQNRIIPSQDQQPSARTKRPRWKLPIVLALGGLLVLVGAGIFVGSSVMLTTRTPGVPAPASPSVPTGAAMRWAVPAAELPADVAEPLRSAVIASEVLRRFVPPARYVELEHAKVAGDWGVLYGSLRYDTDGSPVPTEPLMVLVKRTATGWQTLTAQDREFCTSLKQMPDSVVDISGKAYFIDCQL